MDTMLIITNMFDWNIERDQYGNPLHTGRNIGTAVGWWSTHFLPAGWFLGGDFNVVFSGSVKVRKN